jgi:hypothetical protein
MMFLFTGGHMVGGATNDAFIEKHHADILPRAIYDIAIEHISDDYLPPAAHTGNADARGVFITENPDTVALYSQSVAAAGLTRTLVFPTGTPLGVPTDAQHYGRTDASGIWKSADVQPGTYNVQVWHPLARELRRQPR